MGKRNSQLQELTVVAQNDYLTIVDTSAGQSKRVSVKTLVGNVDLGWVATGESWTFSSWSSTTRIGVITVPSDATTKYTPGMRTRFSQSTGGTKYGIIVGVTTTTVTVFFPSGVTFNNETVTSPVYSSIKVPYGFDASPDVWRLEYLSTSDANSSSNPVTNTWYAVPGASLVVPIGAWKVGWNGAGAAVLDTSNTSIRYVGTLATASGSETDASLSSYAGLTAPSGGLVNISPMGRDKFVKLATQTTYYINMRKTSAPALSTLSMQGSNGTTRISADCAYL